MSGVKITYIFSFKSMHRVKMHSKMHLDLLPYKCSVCEHKFRTNFHLDEHMRLHTGLKPYACEQCDKKFRVKKSLVEHLRLHTGERPFVCDECGQRFSTSAGRLDHMKRIHGEFAIEKCQLVWVLLKQRMSLCPNRIQDKEWKWSEEEIVGHLSSWNVWRWKRLASYLNRFPPR